MTAPSITPSPIIMTLMTEDEVARFGRMHDAGFGALTSAKFGALPLVAMDVDVRVVGIVAATEVAQTFVNSTGSAIEATYIFPLPDRAAVHRFRMEVAGRTIDGIVEERGAARQHYDQAIAAGQRAAITEEERPGVFTLRVGNLMPGEAATVRLSLVGPLPVDDGEVTLQFPLVVAQRYIPGVTLGGEQAGLGTAVDTNLVPDASRIAPPVLLAGFPNPVRLSLRVALVDHDVRDVASSLHAISTVHRDAKLLEIYPGTPASAGDLHSGPGERLNRDFILRWRVAPAADHVLRSALTCADDADGKGGTFMLTLVPPSTATLAGKPRDIVFVLDRSGSMNGWKMVAARSAAARMIDTLTSRDKFAVIAFDDHIDVLPAAELVVASDRNRCFAVQELGKLEARGGTEMAAPLVRAADLLGPAYEARERVIVLVTDGQVGNEDHILREMTPRLRGTRMFTLGIDQAVNAAFLRRLASAGAGLCEVIESQSRLDAMMAKVHRRIGTPVLQDVALEASGIAIEHMSLAPSRLPDVYAGAPVVVFGRYTGRAKEGASLLVSGASLGEPFEQRVVRQADDGKATGWAAASWARARIRELEDRYAAGATALSAQIVETSVTFGVLSRFTAFLAVDRSAIANRSGRLDQVVQAVDHGDGDFGEEAPEEVFGDLDMRMPRAIQMPGGPPPPPGAPPVISMRGPGRDGMVAAVPPSGQLYGQAPPPQPGAPAAARPPAPAPAPARAPGGRVQSIQSAKGAEPMRSPAPPADTKAYLTSLGVLAEALAAQGRAAFAAAAVRLMRQRLAEWIEDLRSVGGQEALAAAVAALVAKLGEAIAAASSTEVGAVAVELGKLAAGAPPPPAPSGRVAFWK